MKSLSDELDEFVMSSSLQLVTQPFKLRDGEPSVDTSSRSLAEIERSIFRLRRKEGKQVLRIYARKQ